MARKKNPTKLKNSAAAAVNKGKYAKALDLYLELEQLEPAKGDHARRAADMYRRMDREPEALLALGRAADKYAKDGFLVKAVAVCKMILHSDPSQSETIRRLASLQEKRGIPAGRSRMTLSGEIAAVAPPPSEAPPVAAKPEPRSAAAVEPIDIGPPDVIDLAPGDDEPMELLDATDAATPPPEISIDLSEPPPAPGMEQRRRTLPPNAPLETITLGEIVPGSVPELLEDGSGSGIIEIPLELELEIEEELDDILDAAEDIIIDDEPEPDESQAMDAAISMRATPLFSALGPDLFQSFIHKIDLIELEAGTALFHQNDPGNTLYVIAEGEVAVISEGPPRVQLTKLGEGEFFGEIALVTEQARNATIEATIDTELLAIDRDVIGDLIEEEPGVLRVLLRFLRDRLLDTLISTSPLFGPFGGDDRESLAAKFKFLEVEKGAALIQQGEKAKGLYVLLSGHAEVTLEDAGEAKRLATLGSGDLCGEMSLLSNGPAVATVRASAKAFVLVLPADAFRMMIMTHPQVLMFVGDLADERKRKFDAIVAGAADYEEGHLDLV